MLTEEQWAAIKDTVNRVVNRESDYEPILHSGLTVALVQRINDDDIGIYLYAGLGRLDLEPADVPDPE